MNKEEHKREQNEQFDRACREIQKQYRAKFEREFKKMTIMVCLALIVVLILVFIVDKVLIK